jgi:putative phage-type endonuclease
MRQETVESDTWHEWRKQGIGSSDAPIIWGNSPYCTPYALWELKTGKKKAWDGNWATRRGHQLEPRARAHYELLNDVDMPPTLVQHHLFKWMRASLDGYNDGVILEIKCPGMKDHQTALDGKVPDHYYPQVQHQLFVSGALRCDYFSFTEESQVTLHVFADDWFIKSYFMKAVSFWDGVEKGKPPALVERDWKLVRSKQLRIDLEEWHAMSLKDLEYSQPLFNRLFQVHELDNRRSRCAGFYIDGYSRQIFTDFPPRIQQQ